MLPAIIMVAPNSPRPPGECENRASDNPAVGQRKRNREEHFESPGSERPCRPLQSRVDSLHSDHDAANHQRKRDYGKSLKQRLTM